MKARMRIWVCICVQVCYKLHATNTNIVEIRNKGKLCMLCVDFETNF